MTTEEAGVAPTCRNHPGVETRLSCSSCGAPICPRCMVATPVGQKCPECARQPGRARGTPQAALLARVFGVSLLTGAAGALVLLLIGFRGGLLLGALYGYGVGTIARKVAGGRSHTLIGVAAAAAVVAALAGLLVTLGVNPLDPGVLLVALIGGGVTFVRAAGIW